MNNPHRKFLKLLLAFSLLGLMGVGILNVLVDPYGLYRLVTREGFNGYKPFLRDKPSNAAGPSP